MGVLPYERELDVARRAVEDAVGVIAAYAGQPAQSWQKAEDHPVTRADLEANEAILRRLHDAFPHDAVISEESQRESGDPERFWLIDPLDGTKEFIAGIPEYAVSVALVVRGEPVLGILGPPSRECFWATRGGGAWLDQRRLAISNCTALAESVVLASRSELGRGDWESYRGWFGRVEPLGSAALKLAWIAAGRADVWLSLAPKNEWDVCAGDVLVREAGGQFHELRTGSRRYGQKDTLLASPLAAGPASLVAALQERCCA